jgi:CRP-like cAMP-binding protein
VVDRQGGYKLPIAYTHKELATMIGAERVTVSRILGQLQNEGLWN